jgi:hypothetical protein
MEGTVESKSCDLECACTETGTWTERKGSFGLRGKISVTLGIDEEGVANGIGFKVWGGIRGEFVVDGTWTTYYLKDTCANKEGWENCVSMTFTGSIRGGVEAKFVRYGKEFDFAAVEIVGRCYGGYRACDTNTPSAVPKLPEQWNGNCDAYARICQWGLCWKFELAKMY